MTFTFGKEFRIHVFGESHGECIGVTVEGCPPGVKGLEFGSGFSGASMRGSENNDPLVVKNGVLDWEKNNAGGILGGITNGAPVVFRVAFKPTPSISKEQQSVDLERMEETSLSVQGRHDPCIVPRAVPVVEGLTAVVFADLVKRDMMYGR